jgi:hypothetical protein
MCATVCRSEGIDKVRSADASTRPAAGWIGEHDLGSALPAPWITAGPPVAPAPRPERRA